MIDVIIPAYRGHAQLVRCVESILSARNTTPFELIIIDDCSPEPELSSWLDSLASTHRATCLRNDLNLGFVATVNRGMRLHPERDVILLNSDTEVANDWLDRLAACAYSAPGVATVMPFSNNASVFSYPFDGWSGGIPGGLGLDGLDALFREEFSGASLDIPTSVGFCMFIRRACLDQIGFFDVDAFGRGYGEENDFCMRALHAGWRHLLACDVFVFHEGGVSFAQLRHELMRTAERTLLRKHPDYMFHVRMFLRQDPLQAFRSRMNQRRLLHSSAEAAAVLSERATARALFHVLPVLKPAYREVRLHLSHDWGGGIQRWVNDFASADNEAMNLVLSVRTGRNGEGTQMVLSDARFPGGRLYERVLSETIYGTVAHHPEYAEALSDICACYGVSSIVASSFIGHSLDGLRTGLPTIVVLHDLYPFCPALFAWFETACTSCTATDVERCARDNILNVFPMRAEGRYWTGLRQAYISALRGAGAAIVAPSRNVLSRWQCLLPELVGLSSSVIPHGCSISRQIAPQASSRLKRTHASGQSMRVVVPGRLLPHKGLREMRQLSAALEGKGVEFILLGCGDFGEAFEAFDHVQVIRNYDYARLAELIHDCDPDCALLLSTLPETFSYTLSEMQALGVPVVAVALGALAERIQDGHDGFLVEPDCELIAVRLLELHQNPGSLDSIRENLMLQETRTPLEMVQDYRDLLGQLSRSDALIRPSRCCMSMALTLQEADALREHYVQDMQHVRNQLQHLQGQKQSLHTRLDEVSHELRSAVDRLNAIECSSSWRMTEPLRRMVTGLRCFGRRAMGLLRSSKVLTQRNGSCMDVQIPSPERLKLSLSAHAKDDPWVHRLGTWLIHELDADLGPPLHTSKRLGLAHESSLLTLFRSVPGGGRELIVEMGVGGLLVSECDIAKRSAALRGGWLPMKVPVIGVWSSGFDQHACRRDVRKQLGIPDWSVLVLGAGVASQSSAFEFFLRVAGNLAFTDPRLRFVWLGCRCGASAHDVSIEASLLAAQRRLFFCTEEIFEPWLLGADCFLNCLPDVAPNPWLQEAAQASLPVASPAQQEEVAVRQITQLLDTYEPNGDGEQPDAMLLHSTREEFLASVRALLAHSREM